MSNNNDNNRKLRVGITHGDTNGIGYEVILKAIGNPAFCELCTPVIYGSSRIMNYHRKAADLGQQQINYTRNAANIKENLPNLVEVIGEEVKIELGQPSKQAGKAAFEALEAATRDLKRGLIDVLVTAPINKDTIQSEGFTFPGHTEYLEASLADEGDHALMILHNEDLRVALVTTHMPISKVPSAITKELVLGKIQDLNKSLERDFGIVKPRIAVLALNPHAGENGLLGKEELEVIGPAIEQAYADGITCFGPYAADGFFGNRQWQHFDGVLAMYHDQGLIPLKTISMSSAVNFTAGLPYVRTSPDHGTAYEIAGKGIADENSMRQAVYAAIDVFRNRERFDEMTANPLRKQYFDRGKDNEVLDLTKIDDEPDAVALSE